MGRKSQGRCGYIAAQYCCAALKVASKGLSRLLPSDVTKESGGTLRPAV